MAFTMIEIAISLAIIGFAMVAIIGVLPIGMNTQKDNREETIINQDAAVLLDAIRNGARGLDYLTNYVMAITNSVMEFDVHAQPVWPAVRVYGYTFTASTRDETPLSPPFPITNGLRIVGLLSTPKYQLPAGGAFGYTSYISNHVVAYVRSISGPANDKFPQDNSAMQDLAFSYRLTSQVVPYWTNYVDADWPMNDADRAVARNLQGNLHDVRLLFRWPLRARGQLGPGSQSFRTLVGGRLEPVSDIGYPLYFFEPRNYTNHNIKVP